MCNSRSPGRTGARMRSAAPRSSCFAPGAGLPLSGFKGVQRHRLRRGAVRGLVLDELRARRRVEKPLLVS